MQHGCQINKKMDGVSSTALFIPDKIMLKEDPVINHGLVVTLEQNSFVATMQYFEIFLSYSAQIWMTSKEYPIVLITRKIPKIKTE